MGSTWMQSNSTQTFTIMHIIGHERNWGMMHGTLDQLKINIDVTASISWTIRNIEVAMVWHFLQSSAHSKDPTIQLYYTNSWRTTHWNHQTEQRQGKTIMQIPPSIEQLKNLNRNNQCSNCKGDHYTAPSAPTTNMASHSTTSRDTAKKTPQTHQQYSCNNTLIMSTTPSTTQSTQPTESQQ